MPAGKIIKKILGWEDSAESVLNIMAAGFLFLMMWVIIIQITMRWLYRAPPGVYEMVQFMMAGSIFFAIAYTEKIGGHVKMDLFLSKLGERPRAVVETVYLFIFLVLFSVITWRSGVAAWTSYITGDTTMSVPPIVTWPARSVAPIGCLFLTVRIIRLLFISAGAALGRKPPGKEIKGVAGEGVLSDL